MTAFGSRMINQHVVILQRQAVRDRAVRRVGTARGRVRRIAIVALARKLLVALWRYVTQGVVPQGAVLKA